MKFMQTLMGLSALILTGFALSAAYVSPAGAEISAQRPNTDIAVIHFRGGRLVQSTEQYGRWFEKRNNGAINYEFFETASTPQSIELTGPNGEVKLFVDLTGKVIKGQWPGHAPKVIYTITKIEHMVFIQTPPHSQPDGCKVSPPVPTLPCPVVPIHPPVVHPPVVVDPPVPQPPVVQPPVMNPYVPLPKDLKSATYADGQFMQVTHLVWEESTASGDVFHYKVVGYNEQSLYLYDAARHTFVTLDPQSKRASLAVNGGYLNSYKTLLSVSGLAETPLPPTHNGVLTPNEKLACVQGGGFVERAGLLGAERCTTSFSDGGLVCTDSAQCQGQCRGELGSDMGAHVTGVCQSTDNPFGCFAEVVNGQAGPGLCVD